MSVEESLTAEIEAAVGQVSVDSDAGMDSEDTDPVQDDTQEEKVEKEETEEVVEDDDSEQGEAESETEGEEETQQDEQVTSPAISDETLTRAIRAGLSLTEARAFPSEQSLLTACLAVEGAQQRASAETGKEDEEDPLAIFDNLNPEEFEPEVLSLLGTLADQIRAQREELKGFRAEQDNAVQVSQQAAAHEVEAWFDKQIEELGADFHKTLGKGSFSSLTPGSSQLSKRNEIAEQMAVIVAGYRATGKPLPPREVVFKQATSSVLEGDYRAIERQKIQKELKRMSGGHIQRAKSPGKIELGKEPTDEIAELLDGKYFAD